MPLIPPVKSSIGGNVAENSGGVHCLKYGVTTNHVLGLKLVLPDGSIVDVGDKFRKCQVTTLPVCLLVPKEHWASHGNYLEFSKHLNQFVFFWQTLPALRQLGQLFPTSSALELSAGMEMMDNLSINAVEDVVATGCYPRDAAAILLEIDGLEVEVAANKQRIAAICKQNGARSIPLQMIQKNA